MKHIIYLLTTFFSITALAGTVDTVSIYSPSMRKSYKCVVVKPETYKKGETTFPTVYLLHGLTGDYSNWITKVSELKKHADTYQLLIVCPDGAYSSWYWDSPVDTTRKFETYIAKEVPAFIEKNYRTLKNRAARAITGLSMGGHGGLFLGFRHAAFFGAVGSMSGALAIEYITEKRYGMDRILGDTVNHKQRYREYSIFGEMEDYPKDSVAIIIDCGVEDYIIEMSRMAHQRLLDLKIPHDYIERPGKHDWNYWATAVEYQLLYFRNYFDKQVPSLLNSRMPALNIKSK